LRSKISNRVEAPALQDLSFGPSQGDASQQILELSRLIGGRFMDDTA
jgi:hypothetical protein